MQTTQYYFTRLIYLLGKNYAIVEQFLRELGYENGIPTFLEDKKNDRYFEPLGAFLGCKAQDLYKFNPGFILTSENEWENYFDEMAQKELEKNEFITLPELKKKLELLDKYLRNYLEKEGGTLTTLNFLTGFSREAIQPLEAYEQMVDFYDSYYLIFNFNDDPDLNEEEEGLLFFFRLDKKGLLTLCVGSLTSEFMVEPFLSEEIKLFHAELQKKISFLLDYSPIQ